MTELEHEDEFLETDDHLEDDDQLSDDHDELDDLDDDDELDGHDELDDDLSDDGNGGSVESKDYRFEFDATGNLVALFESEDGVLVPESIDEDETYALQADGTVLKTELDDGGTETTVYADTNGDGLFERISETLMSLDGGIVRTMSYAGSSGDDDIAVRAGDDAAGGLGSDDFVICEAGHLRIEDFDDLEGDHLVFDTGYGLTKQTLQDYVTSLEVSGADLIIHFGADVSITLVGVAGSPTLSWDDVTVLS